MLGTRFRLDRLGAYALTATLALGAGLAAPEANAADEKVRWKLQTAFPTNLPALGSPAKYLADNVKAASGGDIQIRVYEPGKLVDTLEIISAVSDGKIAAGFSATAYEQGQVPAASLFNSPPFGMSPWAFMAWYYEGPGDKMLHETFAQEGYNLHFELCGLTGPETAGWYTKPLESVEDYKGMKIRFAGLGARVVEKFGASVSLMGGGKLYQALETGRLDATEFSMPMIDERLAFYDVVTYNMYPGWHAPANAVYFMVNGDAWETTSKSTKALISNVCRAATATSLAQNEYHNGKVMLSYGDKGVKKRDIPDDMLKKLREASREVLQAEAEKDDNFKRIWESQKEFLKAHAAWTERAHVPTDMLITE
jgi:TRAP-type mannitol/chloroaromatic compound transport system substrate-binding protein